MDPIGYGLESFDGIGAFRSTDNGQPVDASGQLAGTDVDASFVGAAALGARLAQSKEARDCFAKNWLEYASAMGIDGPAQEALKPLTADFSAGKQNIRELIIRVIRDDSFVLRSKST
jgi:hypothetical protein